jgi:hypothetical protein
MQEKHGWVHEGGIGTGTKVTLPLPIEAAAMDSFVRELRLLGLQKTGVARLPGVATSVQA